MSIRKDDIAGIGSQVAINGFFVGGEKIQKIDINTTYLKTYQNAGGLFRPVFF